MKALALKTVGRTVLQGLEKNAPIILTGMAVTGVVTTGILSTRATIKAVRIIDSKNKEREEAGQDPMGKLEVAQEVGKLYIAPIISGISTAAFAIGATSIYAKRNAALATAYALATDALKSYKEKTGKILGNQKNSEIHEEVAKELLGKNPPDEHMIIKTGNGVTLCMDSLTGQYFRSSAEKIQQAVNLANQELLNGDYVSVNDLYYLFGLHDCSLGSELGWHIQKGLIDIRFDATLTADQEPCLVIDYTTMPAYKFDSFLGE